MQSRLAKRLIRALIVLSALSATVTVFAYPGIEHGLTALPLTIAGLASIGIGFVVVRMWWPLLLVPVMVWPISGWLLLQAYVLMVGDEPMRLSF